MVPDPRCPECAGKVSSTATWCMHCGEDFSSAIDADSGRPVQDHADGRADDESSVDDGSSDVKTVGVLITITGLVTLPLVTPPDMTVWYIFAAVSSGILTVKQSSRAEAISTGALWLAIAPPLIWVMSLVNTAPGQFSMGGLVPALTYTAIMSGIARVIE